MASLQYQLNGNYKHECGATIISDKFLLTAAHCVYGKNVSDFKVILGTDKLNFRSSSATEHNLLNISIHPSYEPLYFYNDTAVLELEETLNFNLTQSPICLPKYFDNDQNSRHQITGTVTGWGAMQNFGQASTELRQARVTIFSQEYCNKSRTVENEHGVIVTNNKLPKLFQSEVLCAGYEAGLSGVTCGGDSGGPLVVYDSITDQYTQVGIVTGGSCASVRKSSIFARLEDPNIFQFVNNVAFDQRFVIIKKC